MPIGNVAIGGKEIWLTAYNASDELARAYCAFAINKAVEVLKTVTMEEVHVWVRSKYPDLAGYIDAVERGEAIARDVPAGQYSVTPGQEGFEVPIIAELRRRAFVSGGKK